MKLLREYVLSTSVHGLPDLYNGKNRFLQFLWAVVIVAAFAGLGIEIYLVFQEFWDSPMMTVFDIKSANSLPFPVVQICPYNFVSKSRVRKANIHPGIVDWSKIFFPKFQQKAMSHYLDGQLGHKWSDQSATVAQINVISQPTMAGSLEAIRLALASAQGLQPSHVPADMVLQTYAQSYILSYMKHREFHNLGFANLPFDPAQPEQGFIPSEETHAKLLSEIYPQNRPSDVPDIPPAPPEIFQLIGNLAEDILLGCMFKGEYLNCSEVVDTVFDMKLGVCYNFATQWSQDAEAVGLTVVMDVRSDDAWESSAELGKGAEVRISTKYEPVSFKGIAIPTGVLAKVSLHGTLHKLEAGSAGACNFDIERRIVSERMDYSDTMCRYDCFLEAAEKTCGCVPLIERQLIRDNTNLCLSFQQGMCVDNMTGSGDYVRKSQACFQRCKPSCEFWDYSPVITYSRLPSEALTTQLKTWGVQNGHQNFTGEFADRMRDNLIILDVAFEQMMYKMISQKPSMTANGFLSQIGGQMGLFAGISLLSVVQVLIYCWHGCVLLCRRKDYKSDKGAPIKRRQSPPTLDRVVSVSPSTATETSVLPDLYGFPEPGTRRKRIDSYPPADFLATIFVPDSGLVSPSAYVP